MMGNLTIGESVVGKARRSNAAVGTMAYSFVRLELIGVVIRSIGQRQYGGLQVTLSINSFVILFVVYIHWSNGPNDTTMTDVLCRCCGPRDCVAPSVAEGAHGVDWSASWKIRRKK